MAGGCPLLNSYTVPGERLRRCSFAEGFKSPADLVQNSESITGTPTVVDGVCSFVTGDRVVYKPQVSTVGSGLTLRFSFKKSALESAYVIGSYDVSNSGCFIRFLIDGRITVFFGDGVTRINDTRDFGVAPSYYADNQWHTITVIWNRATSQWWRLHDGVVVVNAAGATGGTAPVGNLKGLTLGSLNPTTGAAFNGSLKDIKIWDTALDVAEAQAYYNGTMFQFHNRASLSLPMTAECHDPANNRTLDVSGNGNHAVFGAGAQAPVKLSKRGYSFTQTSSQYMDSPFLVTNADWTICVLCLSKRAADRNYLFSIDAGAVNGLISEFFAANQTNWISAQVGVGMTLTPHQGYTVKAFSISRLDIGGGNKLYSLGVDGIIRGTSTTANEQLFDLIRIGARGDLAGFYFNGEVYKLEAWREALNATQIAEWYASSLNQVNRV